MRWATAALSMDWPSYKALCDRPDVLSRWTIERTVELLETPGVEPHPLATVLRGLLASAPLPRPADHSGPPATDMFLAALDAPGVAAARAAVEQAAGDGRLAAVLGGRSTVGFVAAWREYAGVFDAAAGSRGPGSGA